MSAASSVLSAGELGTFRGGSGFPVRYQGKKSGELPFFKVSDMNSDGNELFMSRANNYISETRRKTLGAVRIPAQAIVFAKVGAAVFQERKRILAQDSCIDNNMAAFIVDKGKLDVRFAHYLLTAFTMSGLVAVGALPSLNGGQLRSIPLLVPNDLAEQRRIVAALAEADCLLSTLERLITKKQEIKQGMMQQLLTGRTRLPGFVEPWTTRRLVDVGVTIRGVGYKPDEDLSNRRTATTVDLLRANNIQDASLDLVDVQYVHQRRVRADQFLRSGDILICAANGSKQLVGKAAPIRSIGQVSLTFGAFMMVYRPDARAILPSYASLHFQTKSYRDWIEVLLAGSSINNLRPADLAALEIPLPDRAEQAAIADSLADADDEIHALRHRLTKARAIKVGMMQQLLTGRTRLPAEVVA